MKKKILIGLFCCFVFAGCLFAEAKEPKKVMTTEVKEAKIIDDTKMQPVEELKFDKKAEKQAKKEAKEKQKEIKKQEKILEKQAKKEKIEDLKKQKETLPAIEVSKKTIDKDKVEEEFKEPEIKEVKDIKEDKEIKEDKKEELLEENVKNEEVSKEESKEETEEIVKEEKEEVKEEVTKEPLDPKAQAELHKRNLTFEDIDKNAVSINEFLQFTDKQNEKFSIFYFKTTSKLNAYTKAIENKEAEITMVKRSKIALKAQAEKLEKLEKEADYLYRERDSFYNKSLKKFDSMLTKKQSIKWELLQQMGYRFFPEF